MEGILTELGKVLEDVLSEGYSVTLNSIGSFQTSLTSKRFINPTQVTPREVNVSRIYFIARP